MKIKTLTSAELHDDDLSTFFSHYPFEIFYSLNLNLDKQQFNKFLTNKIKRAAAGKGKLWGITEDGKLLATIGLDKDETSSENYQINIFIIHQLYNFYKGDAELTALLLAAVDQSAREAGADMIKIKIDAEDHQNINYLLREHYHYYASSCKLYFDIQDLRIAERQQHHAFRVRPYCEADLESALAILRQHEKNEKYYNMHLRFENTRKLFDKYFIGQTQKKSGTTVMIMEELKNGEVKGLSVYSEATSFSTQLNKSLLTWDLIVIDKNSRGAG